MMESVWSAAPLVLVVDDDGYAADLTRRFLEALGCRVVVAPDGPSAIHAFGADAGEFAAVVLDYLMPRMNGARVYAELRRIRPDVPIIMCSASSPEEVLAGLPTTDARLGYLPKPYTFEQFESIIHRALPVVPRPSAMSALLR